MTYSHIIFAIIYPLHTLFKQDYWTIFTTITVVKYVKENKWNVLLLEGGWDKLACYHKKTKVTVYNKVHTFWVVNE